MTGRPDVDRLETEIIGSLPRSVDDPAWESPTAAKVRDLAARAREAAPEASVESSSAAPVRLSDPDTSGASLEGNDRATGAAGQAADVAAATAELDDALDALDDLGADRDRWRKIADDLALATVPGIADRLTEVIGERDRLARRVAELEAALREAYDMLDGFAAKADPRLVVNRSALAGDG